MGGTVVASDQAVSRDPGIVEDLKAMLEYYRALGIEALQVELPKAEVTLEDLRSEIGDCVLCKLSKHRKSLVFGEGNPQARLMFIGEAPGREEDQQGRPFVGDAGMLLTRLIERMGLKREEVYIANIIKCRPPMNRDPEEEEVASCRSFIERQISIIGPEVIVTLGRIALQTLMENPGLKITQVRGHFTEFRGIPVMPTFHPAYLLRNPKDKWLTWSDMQKVMKRLGLE
jgi:uracil-DNA glycosylase family 4